MDAKVTDIPLVGNLPSRAFLPEKMCLIKVEFVCFSQKVWLMYDRRVPLVIMMHDTVHNSNLSAKTHQQIYPLSSSKLFCEALYPVDVDPDKSENSNGGSDCL
ncbi:hypothetical protein CEXT_249551 [Caerostris extrusa]|uniref:Uncharacterized protein n=1 Tax=Caerostris extrusa TaxID=172846 RepID=A0AAV4UHA2_CAEEX|nr:hypothetical protein CEXT_249551 [Caerostris extrusa]